MSEQRTKTQAGELLKILNQSLRPLADLEHGTSSQKKIIAQRFQSSGDATEKIVEVSPASQMFLLKFL